MDLELGPADTNRHARAPVTHSRHPYRASIPRVDRLVKRLREVWPIGLAVSGWLAVAFVVLGAPVLVRTLAVFGFVLLGPGLSLVAFLERSGPLERLVLAVAVGTSLATLLAETMSLSAHWSPTLALCGLAALCTGAVALKQRHRLALARARVAHHGGILPW